MQFLLTWQHFYGQEAGTLLQLDSCRLSAVKLTRFLLFVVFSLRSEAMADPEQL